MMLEEAHPLSEIRIFPLPFLGYVLFLNSLNLLKLHLESEFFLFYIVLFLTENLEEEK